MAQNQNAQMAVPNNANTRRITIIDPRNALKEENKEGIVETLVPYN